MIMLDESFITELTFKANDLYKKCCLLQQADLTAYLASSDNVRYGIQPIDFDVFDNMFSCRLLRHFDNEQCQIKRLSKSLKCNANLSNYTLFFFNNSEKLLRSEFQVFPNEKIITIYFSKELCVLFRSINGKLYLYGAESNEYDNNERIIKSESIQIQPKMPTGIRFFGEYYHYNEEALISAEKIRDCFFRKQLNKYVWERNQKPAIYSYSFKYNNAFVEANVIPGNHFFTLKESELKKSIMLLYKIL